MAIFAKTVFFAKNPVFGEIHVKFGFGTFRKVPKMAFSVFRKCTVFYPPFFRHFWRITLGKLLFGCQKCELLFRKMSRFLQPIFGVFLSTFEKKGAFLYRLTADPPKKVVPKNVPRGGYKMGVL